MSRGASEREDKFFFAKNRKSKNRKIPKTQKTKRGFSEIEKKRKRSRFKAPEIFSDRSDRQKTASPEFRKPGPVRGFADFLSESSRLYILFL
jgi:hypothetical protein